MILTQAPCTISEVQELLNKGLWEIPTVGGDVTASNLMQALKGLDMDLDSGIGNIPGEFWSVKAGQANVHKTTKGWRITTHDNIYETYDLPGDAVRAAYEGWVLDLE